MSAGALKNERLLCRIVREREHDDKTRAIRVLWFFLGGFWVGDFAVQGAKDGSLR